MMLARTTPPPARLTRRLILAALASVLALATTLAVLKPAPSLAAGTVDTWDGTADTGWYSADPNADTFTLETAEDLAGLAQLTNQDNPVTFTGKTILLGTDVDLANQRWVAISQNGANSTTSSFSGTFDGQGHVIYNLNNVESTEYRYGLFGVVHGATIKNLGLDTALVAESADSSRLQIGAMVSWLSSSTLENCWATGSVSTPGGYLVGGLVGQCTGGSQLIGCASDVDVTVQGLDGPTVGGLVGQWENAAEDSLIQDCYFSGSVSVASDTSACSGILGACFDFNGAPSVIIKNCLVTTTSFSSPAPDNIVYIAAFDEDSVATNCYWPDNEHAAVVQLVVDWDLNQASADPNFDQTQCGEAVESFADPTLIARLNENAADGIAWSMGVDGHPVLSYQTNLIAADYAAVDAALAKVPTDLSGYTTESAAAMKAATEAVDRALTADRQSEVDAMASAVEQAVTGLEKLADYSAVNTALARADALDHSLYTEDSLAKLNEAVAAVEPGLGETQQTLVDDMASEIEDALAALEYLPADYTAVDAALAKVPADLSAYTAESARAVTDAVADVERGLDITEQDRVDAMASAIEAALTGLEEKPASALKPEPEPQPFNERPALPATGDPTTLVAPALALVGSTLLGAGRLMSRRH